MRSLNLFLFLFPFLFTFSIFLFSPVLSASDLILTKVDRRVSPFLFHLSSPFRVSISSTVPLFLFSLHHIIHSIPLPRVSVSESKMNRHRLISFPPIYNIYFIYFWMYACVYIYIYNPAFILLNVYVFFVPIKLKNA